MAVGALQQGAAQGTDPAWPLPAPAASPRAPRPRPTRPTRRYRHRRAAAEVEAQEAKLAPAVDKLKGMDKNAHFNTQMAPTDEH